MNEKGDKKSRIMYFTLISMKRYKCLKIQVIIHNTLTLLVIQSIMPDTVYGLQLGCDKFAVSFKHAHT